MDTGQLLFLSQSSQAQAQRCRAHRCGSLTLTRCAGSPPAEYEYRRFIKICRNIKDASEDLDEQVYEYEQKGYKIRLKVLKRLWRGGWRGG